MKRKYTDIKTKSAFTLIELLTVIAIIGILAAIIIPVTGRVRSSARAMQCVSNLRQTGNAAHLWSLDNKGRVVAMRDPNASGWKSLATWTGDLAPYASWQKPDGATTFNAATDVPIFTCPQRGTAVFGYGHNWYSLSYIGGGKERWTYYERVPSPSTTVFMTDSLAAGDDTWRAFVRLPANTGETDSIVDFRHPGDTANVLWLDGHVSGAKKSSGILLEPKNWGFVGDGSYNIVTGRVDS